jgi:hypothetical protein
MEQMPQSSINRDKEKNQKGKDRNTNNLCG